VVSDFAIKRLSACKELEFVNLSGCKYLSDLSVEYLAENCKQITVFNLTRNIKITDRSIQIIADNMFNLKELYLYANAQLTDAAFKYLADSQLDGLVLLELCGCQMLSDDSFIALCQKNKNLKSLNLTWCTELTDRAIIEGIVQSGLQIELLSMFGNINVTSECLEALKASNQTSLRTLDLNGCKKIPEEERDYAELKKYFPACEVFVYHS